MQKNGMKISNVSNAFIYTVVPTSLRPLIKQRLRWVYGFIKNAIDYRDMFFKPQYGNLGIVVLPAAGFSVLSTVYFFGTMIFGWIKSLVDILNKVLTVGVSFNGFNFDLFYINTDVVVFVSFIAIAGTLLIIATSRNLAEEKNKFGIDSILFLAFYAMLAPLWMTRALCNVVLSKNTKWR